MERIDTPKKTPYGLWRLGFVTNQAGGAYIKDLQEKLSDTDQEPTAQAIRDRADDAPIINVNRYGYRQSPDGKAITDSKAIYKGFNTGYKFNGQFVYGWFVRNDKENRFEGVLWLTEQELKAYARLQAKFKMGDFYFDSNDECQSFLEDIAEAAIPESWRYRNKQSKINYPILKS